jgi:dTDP-4-dehydrorhamnose reductase
MRLLITGATGYLGHTITPILARTHEVFAGYFSSPIEMPGITPIRLNIAAKEEIKMALDVTQPNVIVHCAALTKPDYCEDHTQETQTINVDATTYIARECSRRSIRLIHISTDLVFDGTKGNYTEEDPVKGVNEYARSKIAAEQAVAAESPESVILRVSVMYGPGNPRHPGFLGEILERWRKQEAMAFFVDQFRTPTFSPQVADAIQGFLNRPEIFGMFHLGGAERLSRYDFAALVAQVTGADESLLKPARMADHPGPAKRPADCSLVSNKIRNVLGIEPMSCLAGLSSVLDYRSFIRQP